MEPVLNYQSPYTATSPTDYLAGAAHETAVCRKLTLKTSVRAPRAVSWQSVVGLTAALNSLHCALTGVSDWGSHGASSVETFTDEGRVRFRRGTLTGVISYKTTSASKYADVNKGTLDLSSSSIVQTRSISLQVIRSAENYVEAAIKASGSASATLGIITSGADWRTDSPSHSIDIAAGLVPEITVVTPEAGPVSLGTYTGGTELRVRVEVTGREVKFYLTEVGTGKPPVYVSPTAPNYPLRAYAQASVFPSGGARARRASVR
jgi:hypothetical protein